MTEATATRSGGKRRRILTLAIAAILLVLLARAGVNLWLGHQIETVASRLEQRYGSLDESTLRIPSVPADENRAHILRAAAALMAGQSGLSNQAFSRFLAQPAPAPVPEELRVLVDANREALRLAADARNRAQSNWEADYARASDLPPWMDIRTLSNTIYLAARLDLEAGRTDDAVRMIASGLALSASVRQEPTLIAQLMRMAVGLRHFEAIQRLVTGAEPSKASLEELSLWLVENRAPDPMHVGMLTEMKHFNAALARAENSDTQALGMMPDLLPRTVARMTGANRWIRLRYLEQMELLLDAATGPRPRSAPSAAPTRWAFLVPGLERALDTGDLFNSALGVTELAVALRRYRIDHGQYPDALSALAPAYVPAVPIDSFTGKPPVYARQGAGFQLRAENPKNASDVTAAALTWTVVK